jgi:formate hydrogenlyase subunit 6/NADH:ubiquinone oxidoreductase subunit I
MNATANWFREIVSGVVTTAKGLTVTGLHVFRQPITTEYPEVNVESQLPERYRGFLQVDMDICIGCHACETDCPILCIVIDDVRGEKTTVPSKITGKPTPKTRYPLRFDIDIAKCMFCGLCTENCPTGAIHHTRKFEGSVLTVAKLTYSYVRPEDMELAKVQEAKLKEKKAAETGAAPEAKE